MSADQKSPDLRAVLALLALFAAAWLWQLSHASLTAPQDNLEQLTWVRSLQWGYYKHPPLPTWLLAPFVQIFGLHAWVTYLLGAGITLLSMLFFWKLLSQFLRAEWAFFALLGALCITFYNGRLYYYNHNTVLMLFVVCSAYASWQAMFRYAQAVRKSLFWWGLAGLALGLGALAKYQMGLAVLCILAVFVQQRAWRRRHQVWGLLLAGALSALIFAPHGVWLISHDFAPFRYARETSLAAGAGGWLGVKAALIWLLDMLLNRSLPAWIFLAGVISLAAWRARGVAQQASEDVALSSDTRTFLLIWGALPLAVMTLMGFAGAELQLQWGTAFLLFAVPAVMQFLPLARLLGDAAWWRSAWLVFLCIQLLLLAHSELSSFHGPQKWRDKHWRSLDSPLLAERLLPAARRELGGKLRLIVGPATVSGALAAQASEQPLILIDGRLDRSPWVAQDLLSRCGALELIRGQPNAAQSDAKPVGAPFENLSWRVIAQQNSGTQKNCD